MALRLPPAERLETVDHIRNFASSEKLTDQQIGDRLGLTGRQVRNLRRRYNIPPGVRATHENRLTPDQQALLLPMLVDLVRGGWSDPKIAVNLGITQHQVWELRRKNSIPAATKVTSPAHVRAVSSQAPAEPVAPSTTREPHCTKCWQPVERDNITLTDGRKSMVAARHGYIAKDRVTRSGPNAMPVYRAVACPGIGKPIVMLTEDVAAEAAKAVSAT